MPEISVIMPAYNTGKYLSASIDSVLAQTFKDWELIVINDGSADDSLDTALGYSAHDDRIKVLDQKKSGVAAAWNQGIAMARGPYLFPLDSADLIAPECLASLLHALKASHCAVASPDGRYFGRSEGPLHLPAISRRNMYGGKNGVPNSALYEKKYWEKYGGYDGAFKGAEAYGFWLNFMDDRKKILRIRGDLFFQRLKPESETGTAQGQESPGDILAALSARPRRMKTRQALGKLLMAKELLFKVQTNAETGERSVDLLGKTVHRSEKFHRITQFPGTGAHPILRPQISIVTICLNEPQLERTCASIVSQTFHDFEWIVIDGGSTNQETLAILEKYRGKMTRFISEKDDGIYDAMNKGIAFVAGKWVNFMNAGDMYSSPEALGGMSRELDAAKADIVYGMVRFDGSGKLKNDCLRMPHNQINHRFWATKTPPHPAMFYKTELFSTYGGFRTDFRIVSDWILNLSFWRKGARYKFADIMVANFDNSGISSIGGERRNEERQRALAEYFPEYMFRRKIERSLYRLLYRFSYGQRLRQGLKRRYESPC